MENKEFFQIGLQNSRRAMSRVIDGLTPDELKWHPRPDANSIGLIIFHMIRAEDSWIHTRLQGKPQLWQSQKWYQQLQKALDDGGAHYTTEQVDSFIVPSLPDLIAYAEAVGKDTDEYLRKLTPAELDRKIELPLNPSRPSPFGPNPTVGLLLVFLVTHLAQHAGEISYLRGLQRGMDK